MREATPENIKQAALVLRLGGVVALPTETVYGLGANALDPTAVARIFEIKQRPSFDPLIVHAPSMEAAFALVASVPENARRLAERFWPGPLTLVLSKRSAVPDIVTSGLTAVGVRVPSHPVALELLRQAGVPIAAPSANRFGGVSPTCAAHVRDEFGDMDEQPAEHAENGEGDPQEPSMPDIILDGGPCTAGVESTVISFIDGTAKLLRPGALPIEEIEALIGQVERGQAILDAADHPVGPGMLKRHYSPTTPMELLEFGEAITPPPSGKKIGLLSLTPPPPTIAASFAVIEPLCPTGTIDMRIAAANLFAAMRRLDAIKLDRIIAQKVDPRGLGLAINDRLQRAAARD